MNYFKIYFTLNIVLIFSACSTKVDSLAFNQKEVFTSKIEKFSNCSDLKNTMSFAKQFWQNIISENNLSTSDSYPSISNPIYDEQSENVSESDTVLLNEKFLFILSTKILQVFHRQTLSLYKLISLDNGKADTLILKNNFLILISTKNYQTTQIRIFDAFNLNEIKALEFQGIYKNIRASDGQLILLTTSYADLHNDGDDILNKHSISAVTSPKCEEIYQSQVNAYSSRVTSIYIVSLSSLEKNPLATGFVGDAGIMYMTENALYLANNSFSQYPSYVRQIKWNEKSIYLHSVISYPGQIKDRWALNEIKQGQELSLALATTITNSSQDMERTLVNQILIYKEMGSELGLVLNSTSSIFGINENIRSVRYLGKLAYVVTFRQTDPLFIFDLGNYNQVHQLGELKVPGFSNYLRPLSDNDLLGIGYDAVTSGEWAQQTGVQISLFDISDKNFPALKKAYTIGVRGSFSLATQDSHALMYDLKSGFIALPVVEWLSSSTENSLNYGNILGFTGAQIFKYHNGQLLDTGRISHSKWSTNSQCGFYWSSVPQDIYRVLMIDKKLVSVSSFGLMVHDPETLIQKSEYQFQKDLLPKCYPGN